MLLSPTRRTRVGWETVNSSELWSLCRQSAQATESAEETVNIASSQNDTNLWVISLGWTEHAPATVRCFEGVASCFQLVSSLQQT